MYNVFMQGVFVILIFLVIKIFQYFNGFVLARLFSVEESITMMVGILIFVSALFLFGILVKKFFPKAINIAWIFIILGLIITSQMNLSWLIIFLAGLFLYALIGTEAQILQSMTNYKNIPRFIPFLLTFLPIVVSYFIPQARVITPQMFYIVSSILAFFASYSARVYGEGKFIFYQKAPPVWLGLFFMIGSGFLYYIGFYQTIGIPLTILLTLILLFYVGGALIIYMSIDERLRQISDKV